MTVADYIKKEVFLRRAQESGCLVVYDPAWRYREITKEIDSKTCAVLDAGSSYIEQREKAMSALKGLAKGAIQQLIIWVPSPKPENDEEAQVDPFSVFSRFGSVFPKGDEDEFKSLCRSAKPDHVTEIEKLFAGGLPSFATVDALDEGGAWPQLKTLLHASSVKEILLGILVPRPDQEAALKESASWATEVKEFIARTLGHKIKTKGHTRNAIADELWRLILFSEFVFDSEGELPAELSTVPVVIKEARGLIYDVCDDLRKHQDYKMSYITKADEVEKDFRLTITTSALRNLGQRDTFSFEERFYLEKFALAVGEARLAEARKILKDRQSSIWLSQESRLAEWTAAERALDLIETVELNSNPSFASLEAIVVAYASTTRELDRRHRNLEQVLVSLDSDHETLDSLALDARRKYLELADKLQREFLRHVLQEGWPAHGSNISQNGEIFDREVNPLLEKGQKVVYFLVDSLRYELATELEKQLTGKNRVKIVTVCAQLPTYTEVGMASLMPNASSALRLVNRDKKITTTLDGAIAIDPNTRFAYLQSKKGDMCMDLNLDDLLLGKKLKIPDKIRLLILRTREIDAVAHESPRGVLQLLPDLIRQIIRGINKLQSAGFQNIIIATDHGFILAQEQDAGNTAPIPPGNWLIKKSRCLLGSGEEDGKSVVFPREKVGIPGDFQSYAVPRALIPYSRGTLYYHEGLSLQECVLPCLIVEQNSPTGQKATPKILLTYKQGSTKLITTRRPVLDLCWPELPLDDFEMEIVVEALDSEGKVVGCVSTGTTVNQATNGVRLRAGQAVPFCLRMDDSFTGSFTVRATDSATQILVAEIKLKTDYTV